MVIGDKGSLPPFPPVILILCIFSVLDVFYFIQNARVSITQSMIPTECQIGEHLASGLVGTTAVFIDLIF